MPRHESRVSIDTPIREKSTSLEKMLVSTSRRREKRIALLANIILFMGETHLYAALLPLLRITANLLQVIPSSKRRYR